MKKILLIFLAATISCSSVRSRKTASAENDGGATPLTMNFRVSQMVLFSAAVAALADYNISLADRQRGLLRTDDLGKYNVAFMRSHNAQFVTARAPASVSNTPLYKSSLRFIIEKISDDESSLTIKKDLLMFDDQTQSYRPASSDGLEEAAILGAVEKLLEEKTASDNADEVGR